MCIHTWTHMCTTPPPTHTHTHTPRSRMFPPAVWCIMFFAMLLLFSHFRTFVLFRPLVYSLFITFKDIILFYPSQQRGGWYLVPRTAILVDGGFYRKRASYLWGKKTPPGAWRSCKLTAKRTCATKTAQTLASYTAFFTMTVNRLDEEAFTIRWPAKTSI